MGLGSGGQHLTSLRLAAAHCDLLEVWPVLGRLTQLHSLCVLGVAPDQLPGMLDLYDCCHLTELQVGTYSARQDVLDGAVRITSEVSHEQCVLVAEAPGHGDRPAWHLMQPSDCCSADRAHHVERSNDHAKRSNDCEASTL